MRTISLTLVAPVALVAVLAAAETPPRVKVDRPVVGVGPMPPPVIRRVIRRGMAPIQACYEQALRKRPTLAGQVVVSFTISPAGQVVASRVNSSTLGDPAAARCVAARVKRLVFPAPRGGGIVKVSYPFAFGPQSARAACLRHCISRPRTRTQLAACRRSCRRGPPPPAPPASTDRACKRQRDCVFAPPSGCGCPPCGPTRRRAVNRKHAAWLRREYARESCPKVKCARCGQPVTWLESRVVCLRGQCEARP